MRYRLIALDLDGTLLDDRKLVSERNKNALQEASRKGVQLAFASARGCWRQQPLARELGLEVGIIACNGAEVRLPGGSSPLFRSIIPGATVQSLLETERPVGAKAKVYVTEESFPPGSAHVIDHYPGMTTRFPGPVLQVVFNGPDAPVAAFGEQLRITYGAGLSFSTAEPGAVEVNNPGINKGTGLARLAEALGIEAGAVIAMGNGENDLPMLAWAGMGYAMGNSPESVRRRFGRVAPRHDEDGVARIIEALV